MGPEGFERDRMIAVLANIAEGHRMYPVKVAMLRHPAGFAFEIEDGAHRFYASVAAGYSYLPGARASAASVIEAALAETMG